MSQVRLSQLSFRRIISLDLRFSRKRTWWGIPVTAFTEIWNIYNSPNKIRFNFADKLVEEFKAAELEDDLDEFPFDLESPEYKSPVRFPFNISVGFIYEIFNAQIGGYKPPPTREIFDNLNGSAQHTLSLRVAIRLERCYDTGIIFNKRGVQMKKPVFLILIGIGVAILVVGIVFVVPVVRVRC